MPIKSRTDLATIPETIVGGIKIKFKKLFFRYTEFQDNVRGLENIHKKSLLKTLQPRLFVEVMQNLLCFGRMIRNF